MSVAAFGAAVLAAAASMVVSVGQPASADSCSVTSAIGIPTMTVRGQADAGAVEVRASCLAGPQLLTLPTPHAGDRFGASLADVVLSEARTRESLLVGVPGYDVGALRHAGAFAIFDPTASRFELSSVVTQNSTGVAGRSRAGARFGTAVSSFSLNPDNDGGGADVVVGEPGRTVGGEADAGGYVSLEYQLHERVYRSSETTLDTSGIAHAPQHGDLLGSAVEYVEGKVVAGAPGRRVDGHAGAGAVLFGRTLVTQDTACMPGAPAAGNHFGASLANRWIGVPGQDVGSLRHAGMVERYDPASRGRHRAQCYALTQNTPGMVGIAEANDRFGAALGEFHTNDCDVDLCYSPYQLAIGVPGEDVAGHRDCGFVDLVDEKVTNGEQDTFTIHPHGFLAGPGTSEARFGTAFGEHVFDLQISAPGAARVYAYRNQDTPGQSPSRYAVYRPSVPVPADSYGLSLTNHDE